MTGVEGPGLWPLSVIWLTPWCLCTRRWPPWQHRRVRWRPPTMRARLFPLILFVQCCRMLQKASGTRYALCSPSSPENAALRNNTASPLPLGRSAESCLQQLCKRAASTGLLEARCLLFALCQPAELRKYWNSHYKSTVLFPGLRGWLSGLICCEVSAWPEYEVDKLSQYQRSLIHLNMVCLGHKKHCARQDLQCAMLDVASTDNKVDSRTAGS